MLHKESLKFTKLIADGPEGTKQAALQIEMNDSSKTPVGVIDEFSRSFVLVGREADDLMASLRLIKANLNTMVDNANAAVAAKAAEVPVPATEEAHGSPA